MIQFIGGFDNTRHSLATGQRCRLVVGPLLAALVLVALVQGSQARDLTLDAAISIALNQTAKGEMIQGGLEVAQQKYSARRINMYLPEISINGNLPTFSLNESYRPFTNSFDRQLFEERSLDFTSFIQLKQTLFTGGSLTAQANLMKQDNRYPDTRFAADADVFVSEDSRRGFLNLELDQPLFRPSSVKNELHNRRNDLEIARMTRVEEEAALKKEVTEAYLGTIQQTLQLQIARDKLESASIQVEIDSMKLADGIISEEDYLLSTSALLDAELSLFDIQTQLDETRRELRILLDLDVSESLTLAEPEAPDHFDEAEAERYAAGWEYTVPVVKAEHTYLKAERAAEFEASGHGLTGDLRASYSLGRQDIEKDLRDTTFEDNIKTSGWTVSLEFSLPIWDGGAGRAAVRGAEFEAERAKYEYTRARRSARATIQNLINQLDVGYQRLDIIRKQIDLGRNRLDIAESRYADGQISELTLLETKISYQESKDRYLEELISYLLNRIELQGKFIS
ncbi:hypothetical protein GF377_09625 [candidate division GN15 bacterium]|nr:hypothetical protein [candidate division GN15 bacterium]